MIVAVVIFVAAIIIGAYMNEDDDHNKFAG
jgi:hypothetical protein